MNKSKHLVVLKTPGTSFMVDSCDKGFLKDIKYASFIQEDKMLYIPIPADCNIAYVMEMSEEDVAAFNHSIEMQRSQMEGQKSKLIKPKFIPPSGKLN